MPSFEAEVVIARPRWEVFDLAADLERWPTWLRNMRSVERRSAERGAVGSTCEEVVDEEDGLSTYQLKVVARRAPDRFTYMLKPRAPGAHVVVDYEIQEAPEGARVRLTYSYYFARWVSLLRLVWWWERAKPFLDEPDP